MYWDSMTKYLDREFSVHLGSDAYRNNWDAVFGKKTETQPPPHPQPPVVDRFSIYKDVEAERAAQDIEHGGPNHDDVHTPDEWAMFITQHAARGLREPDSFRKQMVRVAALAVAAIEVHDRKVKTGP